MDKSNFQYPDEGYHVNQQEFTTVSKIIGQYKIKYNILSTKTNIPKGIVYFYIDLEPLWKMIYRSDILKVMTMKNQESNDLHYIIFLNILSLVLHYRNFIESSGKPLGVSYKVIFLDISDTYAPRDALTEIYPKYRFKDTNGISKDDPRYDLYKAICKSKSMMMAYLNECNNVRYIQEASGDHMIIPYAYSQNIQKDHKNIIISADRYIESYMFYEQFVPFIRTYKGMLYGDSLLDMYNGRIKDERFNVLSNKFLHTLFQSVSGNTYRNIPKLIYLNRTEILYYIEDFFKYGFTKEQKYITGIPDLHRFKGEISSKLWKKTKSIPDEAFEYTKLYDLDSMKSLCNEDLSKIDKHATNTPLKNECIKYTINAIRSIMISNKGTEDLLNPLSSDVVLNEM